MKIIILEGKRDKGKTTTIGMVFIALHIKGGSVKSFTYLDDKSNMDFDAVLDYPTDVENKLKVALYSKGDKIDDCNDAINRYSPTMDVLVIAYSTKKTLLTIPQKDEPIYIKKKVASCILSQGKANKIDCRKIMKYIG